MDESCSNQVYMYRVGGWGGGSHGEALTMHRRGSTKQLPSNNMWLRIKLFFFSIQCPLLSHYLSATIPESPMVLMMLLLLCVASYLKDIAACLDFLFKWWWHIHHGRPGLKQSQLTIECEYVFIFSFQSQWSPEIFLLPFPRPHVCSFSVCHVIATYMSLLLRSSYYSSSTAETPTGDGSGVFGLRLESVFLHTSLVIASCYVVLIAPPPCKPTRELCRRPWSDMICIMKR